MSQPHQGGVPLDEWRKDIPPGWKPGVESYPLKLFFSKLKLWYRCCEVPDEVVGPLIAGRLQGRAQRIALELKLVRPDGTFDVGDAALVRLSVDEVIDPADGVAILQRHIPSGVQALCNALRDAFGDTDEAQTTKALEVFFEHKRPHGQELQEFAAEWDLRYEDAKLKAGLDMNPVAKSYLWLKQSGLTQKHQDDLRLQVHGDLSRFNDLRALAIRLSHRVADRSGGSGDVFYEEDINCEHSAFEDWYGWSDWDGDGYWAEAWWHEDEWSNHDDGYQDGTWYEDDEEFYEAEEQPWTGDPASEPGYQGEDSQRGSTQSEGEAVYSAGSGRGKGSGPFGSGCYICGSKWHMAADCPVRGKGKGNGKPPTKGKGKGKFRKGKSKGKYSGKSSGKSTGKYRPQKGAWGSGKSSSWHPRYFVNYDHNYEYDEPPQLRHARVGLHLGDSPPKEPPRPPVPSARTQHFDIKDPPGTRSEYFEDLLRLERAGKAAVAMSMEEATAATSDQNAEASAAAPSKNLTFFFRTNEDNSDNEEGERHRTYHGQPETSDIYHTVGGRRRRGLIIDPGAANGLIGTETLRDLLKNIDKAKQVNDTLVWKPKQSEVTGISGAADTTLGEVTLALPMIPGLESAHYKADVIGGDASMCPALVGNPALVNMKAVLASNWFSNKDGLLIIPDNEKEMHMIRLLYTDSRHYLLPLDSETDADQSSEAFEKAKTFLMQAADKSKEKWNDVRTWFAWATTPKRKRSQDVHRPQADEHDMHHQDKDDDADLMNYQKNHDHDRRKKEVRFEVEETPTATTTTSLENVTDSGAKADQTASGRATPTATTTSRENVTDSGGPNYSEAVESSLDHQFRFATQVLSDEVLATSTIEARFDTPTIYPGDSYPPGLPAQKAQKLDRQYKAIHEEFYNKSGYLPVSPENFHQWKQTAKAKKKAQFWEICSGSGRLSYIALLAGLTVAFPVDFRYGWDLGNASHQTMLLEAQSQLQPDTIMFSPSCGPWSTSANRLAPEDAERLRDEERRTLMFIKKLAKNQVDEGRGVLIENPWGSALWKKSVLSNIENEMPGFRPKQRADQCVYGAVDEHGKPIQKATGLQANFTIRNSTQRCRGHRQGHGVLQATFKGMNRTTLAAVYPHQFCRAMVKDIKKFIEKSAESFFIGYKCQKCALGKDAPPGTEHTLVPRECRHASALPTPATSSSSQAPVEPPHARTAVTTPIPQLLEEYKQAAMRKPNLDDIKLQLPEGFVMTAVDTLMIKSLLTDLVNDSVNIISERKGKHNHWSQDPLHLAILRKVFNKVMNVKGVCTSLHAETFPLPMPFLRTESAPLRMIIRGEVKAWTLKTVEDLRTYADSQLRAKSYNEDWVIAIFGSAPKDKDYWEIDRARGRALRHHLQPRVALFTPREDEGPITVEELASARTTMATPYDSPGPKVVIRDEWTSRDSSRAALEQGRWTGTTEFQIQAPDDDEVEHKDPIEKGAEAREQQLDNEDQQAEAEINDVMELEESGAPIDPPRRSNFDFRRVLVRLPRLARHDVEQAKRLILGLHERFWHANAGDLQSLLTKSGMPSDVVKLVPEVIAGCSICRKFSKLKSKPTVKAKHPMTFGEEVQADYFQLWDQWFIIFIDVATRYKVVTKVSGRDLPTALHVLLHNWLRFFGPMRKLVSDQESCLMSHEAAAELERLNISREPAGTTRGKAQGQHTTTGLVEKHTDLVKIHMLKIRAEAERAGIEVSESDIAAEAGFAQNATVNLGGYTPHMLVTGSLPFPFYDIDSAGLQTVSGANMTRPSVFENALRLRQIALAAASQAITEDRIARAGHTRPQRLPTENMQPGVTEIEFHREDADGLGWRGPGLLLKLQDNGSAIIEYQGRPYLVPLRNLRVFRGTYYANHLSEADNKRQQELDSWLSLRSLMQSTEACVPFRIDTFGHIKNSSSKWTLLPKAMDPKQRQGILDDIVKAASFLTSKECHGIRVGVGLKKMITPAGTTGTLVAWKKHTVRISIVDNPRGTHMATTNIRMTGREDMCFIYFYSYAADFVEPPPSDWLPRGTPMEEAPLVPTDPPSATRSSPETITESMDVDPASSKRDGPESRTVTLGPENKKQRTSWTLPPSEFMDETFMNMVRSRRIVQLDEVAEDKPTESFHSSLPTTSSSNLFYMSTPGWLADLHVGNIFRVDSETDLISEDEAYNIWPECEEGDFKEVGQFVDQDAFKPVRRDELGKDCAIIDAIWVRKWKRTATGKIVKSRLCARGCHDPWKHLMSSRSTTATRLSQRLILLSAANVRGKILESWDVAGAFLKGLTYKELWRALRELGLQTVERLIAIDPPRNVWRHLKRLGKRFNIPEEDLHLYVLLCLKPVYGLSEAPLAWQLFLHKFLRELGAQQSHFDENYWFWPDNTQGAWPRSSLTTHVDDLAVEGFKRWLDETFTLMVKKFGKLSRESLPFNHCGCRYSATSDGLKVDQSEYVNLLKPVSVNKDDSDDRFLTPQETTTLRSAVGGLMWTSLTRPDLLAELSCLQSIMNKGQVKHLKDVNLLIARAKRDKDAAIFYRPLLEARYRIVVIHDASAATSTKNYAQEGVIVVLMNDFINTDRNHIVASDEFARSTLSGKAQLLHVQSSKAKRVSYSTSHGETLAAINGLECATLVTARLAEITYGPTRPSVAQLLAVQENGCVWFPADSHTDCKDFYELSTGARAIPQDKSQRLYLIAHREARASGRLRWLILTPTECMTADSLTKVMTSPCMMKWLTTGCIDFWNTGHPLELKRLPPTNDLNEDDLLAGDEALMKKIAWFSGIPLLASSNRLFGMVMLMSMATPVAAQPDANWSWQLPDLVLLLAAILISISSAAIAVSLDRCCCRRVTPASMAASTTSPLASAAAASSSVPTTTAAAASAVSATSSTTEPATLDVYVRKGGHSYHTPQCVYAQGGKKYAPCGFCNPHKRQGR